MSNLVKNNYPFDKMKLKCLYKNENIKMMNVGIEDEHLNQVYGESLQFPEFPKDRPYTYSSLVTSIDGRIAFNDAPEGPFIASKNYLAKEGSVVDWYTLNVLRASADAIIFGANTLKMEPNGTGHVYDESLEKSRVRMGKNEIPWNVIPTLDGTDIPYDHIQFTGKQIPIIFYTTPNGVKLCQENSLKPVVIINDVLKEEIQLNVDVNYIVVTGDKVMDNVKGMKILHSMGIKTLLVESPSLMHLFIQDQLMDELFLNYSCVYLGGDSLTIGKNFKAFDSKNHPHTSLITVYMHSSHYMYLRHKVIYDVKEVC